MKGKEKTLESVWRGLEDILFDEREDKEMVLSEDYYIWEAGVTREEIWMWFDRKHPKGIMFLLYEFE